MSGNPQQELKRLNRESTQLAARVRDAIEASRYRRGKEALPRLLEEVEKARRYMELARRALDGDFEVERGPQSGWFKSKMSVLTGRIVGDDEEHEVLADPADPAPTPAMDGDVDFQGSSAVFSIPDLLGFLQVQSKTGVLRVDVEDERIYIEVENGDLVHAYSENSPPGNRLGEILVAQGAIDEERLESFLYCYAPSRGMLGHALNQGELVTEAQLRAALDYQVQQLFHRLFEKRDAKFAFKEGRLEKSDGRTRLNVTQLLLESARMHDEAQPPLPSQEPYEVVDSDELASLLARTSSGAEDDSDGEPEPTA